MAYSGRCFLSKYFNDRNANLGDCSQPCRWSYKISADSHEPMELVEEEHGSYILNSKDLCLIKRMPELVEAGVSAFKIEGRAKSVYYLANIVGAYRKAIDIILENTEKVKQNKELNFLYKELKEKLFHRGYTEGFMFEKGKEAQNLDNSHNLPEWEFCGQVISQPSTVKSQLLIKVHNTMKVGDSIEIVQPSYDIIKMKIKKMINAKNGKEINEAHGGGSGDSVFLEIKHDVPEYSVIRRYITHNA
jgi:putative protease